MATVTFIGGGIAGLTGAIALQRAGIDAHVHEAAQELRAVGAGIWLPPNAMQVLARLGLGDAVTAAGMPLRRIEVRDRHAGMLSRLDLDGIVARLGHTTIALRRSELQRILAAALQPGTLHLGRTFVSCREDGDAVTAAFATGEVVTCDLLLGADGIDSAVRGQLFPDASLRYSGQTCYRGLADHALAGDLATVGSETWGGTHRFGFSAVAPERAYWFAPVTAPAGEAMPPAVKAMLLRAYADFPGPALELLAATPETAILRTDLYDLAPLRHWSVGRVGLMGDAAHATTPNLGQGGAQAIEDALCLASCIAAHGARADALVAYERRRRARALGIVRMSRTFARISHWTSPAARCVRNRLLRSMPAALERRQAERLFTPVA